MNRFVTFYEKVKFYKKLIPTSNFPIKLFPAMQCNKEHSVVPNQTSEGAHENINQNNSSSVDNEVLNLDCNDNIISEGKAKIRNPKNVFYNPVQEFNRDLTVLVATRLASRKAIHQPIIFKVWESFF